MTNLLVDHEISTSSSPIERALFANGDLPEKFEQVLLKHSILEREQERELIREHHEAQNKLDTIVREEIAKNGTIPLSHKDEIRALEAQILEKETLFLKHSWRLIFYSAKDFFRKLSTYKNLSKIKILFEGAKGLLYALRNFKLELDDSFTTYSVPCIKGYIRNLFKAERKIAFNIRNISDRNLYDRVMKKFWQRNNREVGDHSQLAQDLNLDLANLKLFVQQLRLGKFRSLTSTVGDSDTKFSDLFAVINPEDPTLEPDEIKAAVEELNPKQRVILSLRYGIKYLVTKNDIAALKEKHPNIQYADFSLSHDSVEISEIFGYTLYGIRKIEEGALDKLVARLEAYRPKLYWIPEKTNIEGLKQLLSHLFDHKQNLFNNYNEFTSSLLHRLANQKFNYRYNSIAVIKPNEEKTLRLRLGLIDGCSGELTDIGILLANKQSPDKVIAQIRKTETEAIRKIYAFFNSKNPRELREFFYPETKNETATEPYSRKSILEAFERYLEERIS